MTELATALEQRAQPVETKTVLDLIERIRPEVERSLQSAQAAEILTRHYYTAIRFTPLLMQCTAESQVAALLLTAQLRLEPGPLGHVYLIPRKVKGAHEVQWMLGYVGIAELARRGGAVALRSTVVWDCDEYVRPWENEKGMHWTHVPVESETRERSSVLVSWKANGERQAIDVPSERIERARKASAAHGASSGPWFTDEDAMWRKTGVRAARPWLPLSADLATASTFDGATVVGVSVEQGEALPVIESGGE